MISKIKKKKERVAYSIPSANQIPSLHFSLISLVHHLLLTSLVEASISDPFPAIMTYAKTTVHSLTWWLSTFPRKQAGPHHPTAP